MIDPAITELAQAHLTENQYTAWNYHIHGMSTRAIAYRMDTARTTTSDRIDAAWRKLRQHGITVTPDGQPHLEEQTPA